MSEQPDTSVPGLAPAPASRIDKILGVVPRLLASHLHIIFLLGLGIYLIVLPLFGVNVSSKSELIGGNYTNVTSDIGACIAAGGTLHLIRSARRRTKIAEATHRIIADLYRDRTGGHHEAAIGELTRPGGKVA